MAAIDYGVLVFKNGKQIYCDELYPIIVVGDFSIECFKHSCEISNNGELVKELYGASYSDNYDSKKLSLWLKINGIQFHIKKLLYRDYRLTFTYGGDHYTVLYGYGIDNSLNIWDDIKVKYLGKRAAKIIDNEIEKARRNNGG